MRNEIFTVQDVIAIRNEYESYKSMWYAPETDYVWSDVENDFILNSSKAALITFEEWFQLHLEGWSNDEIICGHLINS